MVLGQVNLDQYKKDTESLNQIRDFYLVAQAINKLKQLMQQQIQLNSIKHPQNDSFYIKQFRMSEELDKKAVNQKKMIQDAYRSFRIFSDFFTFSQASYQYIRRLYIYYINAKPNVSFRILITQPFSNLANCWS